MWVKDVKNYDVEIYKEQELLYSGNVDSAPDELKSKEAKSMKIDHKKIIIEV